jgi:hypothetical protein
LPFGAVRLAKLGVKSAFLVFIFSSPLFGSNRIPEAAFMARSYLPSKVSELVSIWRNDLSKVYDSPTEIFFMGLFFYGDLWILPGKQSIGYRYVHWNSEFKPGSLPT